MPFNVQCPGKTVSSANCLRLERMYFGYIHPDSYILYLIPAVLNNFCLSVFLGTGKMVKIDLVFPSIPVTGDRESIFVGINGQNAMREPHASHPMLTLFLGTQGVVPGVW